MLHIMKIILMLADSSSIKLSFPEVSAIVGVISACGLAYIGIRKLGPEKDSIYISSAQGAAVIMEGLIGTLRTELERERKRTEELEADIEHLQTENKKLRKQLEDLNV